MYSTLLLLLCWDVWLSTLFRPFFWKGIITTSSEIFYPITQVGYLDYMYNSLLNHCCVLAIVTYLDEVPKR